MQRSVIRPTRGGGDRSGPSQAARIACLGLIPLIGAADPRAQTPVLPSDPLAAAARDRDWADAFAALLNPERPQDWARGLELARAAGRFGLPVLAELAARESADLRRRLLLLGAAAVGSGPAADGFLLEVAQRAPSGIAGTKERVLSCLLFGFGGPRAGPEPALQALASRRGLQPIEVVAIALALARAPGAGPVPERWYQDEDPAVVAAAVFARAPRDPRWLSAFAEREPAQADLVRRGLLLGPAGADHDPALAARLGAWLARGGDDARALRAAVVAGIARSRDPEAWFARLGDGVAEDLVHVFAAEPAGRRLLARSGRLAPPPSLWPAEIRARLAVAFALATDLDGWREAAPAWGRDAAAGPALCLALAWRFLREQPARGADWVDHLPEVREADWVRLACGIEPRAAARAMPDERLDRLFLIAVQDPGRVSAAAVADEIEDALWRSGAHPAATRYELELDLLRDLALAGSTHGAAVLGLGSDPRRRHLPRGIPPGDPLFEIGFELYRAFRAPAPRRPGWVRLR